MWSETGNGVFGHSVLQVMKTRLMIGKIQFQASNFILNKYLFDHYLNNMCVKLLLYGLKAKWMRPITFFGNFELNDGLTLFDLSFSFSRWPGGRWIPPPLLCIENLSKMYIQLYIYKEHRCKVWSILLQNSGVGGQSKFNWKLKEIIKMSKIKNLQSKIGSILFLTSPHKLSNTHSTLESSLPVCESRSNLGHISAKSHQTYPPFPHYSAGLGAYAKRRERK